MRNSSISVLDICGVTRVRKSCVIQKKTCVVIGGFRGACPSFSSPLGKTFPGPEFFEFTFAQCQIERSTFWVCTSAKLLAYLANAKAHFLFVLFFISITAGFSRLLANSWAFPHNPPGSEMLDMLQIENKRLRFCFYRHRNKLKNVAFGLKINWNLFELDKNAYALGIFFLLFRLIDMVIYIVVVV